MDYEQSLLKMLQDQFISRGIKDHRILDVFQRVPRHLFVPEDLVNQAYEDKPLTLPEDRATISQPYMVAYMTQSLECRSTDRILEIGTGSGYQAAILSFLCKEVYTIERHYSLSINAQRTLQHLGRENVQFKVGDGLEGWEEKAPFDKIIVTAATRRVPSSLTNQLAENGMLLIPIGDSEMQTLSRIRKKNGEYRTESMIPCVFVPLISKQRDLTQTDWNEDQKGSL